MLGGARQSHRKTRGTWNLIGTVRFRCVYIVHVNGHTSNLIANWKFVGMRPFPEPPLNDKLITFKVLHTWTINQMKQRRRRRRCRQYITCQTPWVNRKSEHVFSSFLFFVVVVVGVGVAVAVVYILITAETAAMWSKILRARVPITKFLPSHCLLTVRVPVPGQWHISDGRRRTTMCIWPKKIPLCRIKFNLNLISLEKLIASRSMLDTQCTHTHTHTSHHWLETYAMCMVKEERTATQDTRQQNNETKHNIYEFLWYF